MPILYKSKLINRFYFPVLSHYSVTSEDKERNRKEKNRQ